MRYKLHGRSGLRVSELCLGTMTFGMDPAYGGADALESRAMFDAFAEAGGTFIDTAHMYADGESERLLGEFTAADRDQFVIASKYTPHMGADISKGGNSRKTMRLCVEASLKRLKTDHIDLYLIHYWDYTTPIEEIMRGLDDLVRSGKVLYVGASNLPAWRMAKGNALAELRGWSSFISAQVEYSLLQRTAEREIIPMAEEEDLGVTAWSPLARGVLSGKFLSAEQTEPSRLRRDDISPRDMGIAEGVAAVAREIGRSPSQVALAALRQLRPEAGVIPIVGGRTLVQLADNIGCLDLVLDQKHLSAIDDLSAIDHGVPSTTNEHPYMRDIAFGQGMRSRVDNHRMRRLGRPI